MRYSYILIFFNVLTARILKLAALSETGKTIVHSVEMKF